MGGLWKLILSAVIAYRPIDEMQFVALPYWPPGSSPEFAAWCVRVCVCVSLRLCVLCLFPGENTHKKHRLLLCLL